MQGRNTVWDTNVSTGFCKPQGKLHFQAIFLGREEKGKSIVSDRSLHFIRQGWPFVKELRRNARLNILLELSTRKKLGTLKRTGKHTVQFSAFGFNNLIIRDQLWLNFVPLLGFFLQVKKKTQELDNIYIDCVSQHTNTYTIHAYIYIYVHIYVCIYMIDRFCLQQFICLSSHTLGPTPSSPIIYYRKLSVQLGQSSPPLSLRKTNEEGTFSILPLSPFVKNFFKNFFSVFLFFTLF